jgi:hypothetical protein
MPRQLDMAVWKTPKLSDQYFLNKLEIQPVVFDDQNEK